MWVKLLDTDNTYIMYVPGGFIVRVIESGSAAVAITFVPCNKEDFIEYAKEYALQK